MIHRALEHRVRAFVALLLATAAVLTLAACGGDDKGGSSGGGDSADARTLLEETFSGTKEIRSGNVALTIRVAETGGEAFSIGLSGPFEQQGEDYPKFDIDLDARLGAQGDFSAGLVSTSDRLFVKLEGSAYEIPAEYLDMARSQAGVDERRFELPDFDPQAWIENPEVVGEEEIGGVKTQHIRASMNVSAFLDSIDRMLAEVDRQGLGAAAGGQVPTSIPAETRTEIERTVKDPKVDVWTGSDDKTLRKLEVTLGVEPEGERSGTAAFVLELTGLNDAQTIAAPKDVRPIDQLLAGLGGLLGMGGLGGDSGGDLGTTSEWQRCLEDAGADVEKAQRCAELMTR